MLDARLHTFLTLCDTMNYTRAAERLCMTQPAVTQHIHFLESHYGCRLFHYEGKTLSLTHSGLRLRELARSLAYNSLKIEQTLAAPDPIALRLGATKTIGDFVIAPYVARFLRQHPECTFSLSVENTQVLLHALEQGTLDLAFVEGFFDKGRYGYRRFRQEPFFGICAADHPLAGTQVELEALFEERLVVREEGSGTRAIFEELLHQHNYTLSRFAHVTQISDFSVLNALVASGLGISFVYGPVAEDGLATGTLARFDLTGSELRREFNLVYLRDNLFVETWGNWLND